MVAFQNPTCTKQSRNIDLKSFLWQEGSAAPPIKSLHCTAFDLLARAKTSGLEHILSRKNEDLTLAFFPPSGASHLGRGLTRSK